MPKLPHRVPLSFFLLLSTCAKPYCFAEMQEDSFTPYYQYMQRETELTEEENAASHMQEPEWQAGSFTPYQEWEVNPPLQTQYMPIKELHQEETAASYMQEPEWEEDSFSEYQRWQAANISNPTQETLSQDAREEYATSESQEFSTDLEVPYVFDTDAPYDSYGNSYVMPRKCYGYFSVSADFLYWTLASGMREVSISHTPTEATFTTLVFGDYKKQLISTNYKPGVRVGASYAPCCQDWTLAALYTDFHATFRNHFSPRTDADDALIIPTQWPEWFFTSTTNQSRSHFRVTYQTLDICLHYTPSPLDGCCRMWQPYVGVRLLDLQQRWKVHQCYALSTASNIATFNLLTRWKSKLPAVGLTLGIKGNYALCRGFSLLGSLGASCVGGSVKNHAKYKIQNIISPIEPYTLRSHATDVFTGWEASIGLAYLWTCGNWMTQFSIGYEFQNWLNMPTRAHDSFFLPGNSLASGLNFTLHGLFIKGSLSF